MSLDTETLRQMVFEYLRNQVKSRQAHNMQWNYVLSFVANKAREQDPRYPSGGNSLNDRDGARLKHVLWDMIIERILVPGSEQANIMDQGWPIFSLTEYGKEVLASQNPVPYDPDGYLKTLKADVPTVNDAMVQYLAEALGTFRTGNLLASAVMLGAASEMVFNELCATIPPVMADQATRDKLTEKLTKGKMKDRINTIVGWCRNQKTHLPATWSGDEQVEDIERIADIIRRRRNEAGHPQDPPARPSREQMYSYLMVFPEYCKHLHVLKDWAIANVGFIK